MAESYRDLHQSGKFDIYHLAYRRYMGVGEMRNGGCWREILQFNTSRILSEGKHRWLRPHEICEVLRNPNGITISKKPTTMPPSMTFCCIAFRYFRKDGYRWKKAKDGKSTKEAHERLKVGGVDTLHCYYAHGEEDKKFQRRSYWMIDKYLSHIVLVHYLDVKGDTMEVGYIKETQTAEVVQHSRKTDKITPNSEMDCSAALSCSNNGVSSQESGLWIRMVEDAMITLFSSNSSNLGDDETGKSKAKNEEEGGNDINQVRKRPRVTCGQQVDSATQSHSWLEWIYPMAIDTAITDGATNDATALSQSCLMHRKSHEEIRTGCKCRKMKCDSNFFSLKTCCHQFYSQLQPLGLLFRPQPMRLLLPSSAILPWCNRSQTQMPTKIYVCTQSSGQLLHFYSYHRLASHGKNQTYSEYDMGKNLTVRVEAMKQLLQPKVQSCDSKEREFQDLAKWKKRIEAKQAAILAEIDGIVKETETIQAQLKKLLLQQDQFKEDEGNIITPNRRTSKIKLQLENPTEVKIRKTFETKHEVLVSNHTNFSAVYKHEALNSFTIGEVLYNTRVGSRLIRYSSIITYTTNVFITVVLFRVNQILEIRCDMCISACIN
ncbi:unnamed protein product [Malus baccata var. baccata]